MTAIEFFARQLVKEGFYVPNGIYEQAMEKEKEQIIDSVFFGIHLEYNKIDSPLKRAEQYYNETFSNKGD